MVTLTLPLYGMAPALSNCCVSRSVLRLWSAAALTSPKPETVPKANVRALHLLAPAPMKAGPTMAASDPTQQPTAPAALVERRTPSDGYRRATEAHRQAIRTFRVDPAIAEAVGRQTAAMRALSRRAFPEPVAEWNTSDGRRVG